MENIRALHEKKRLSSSQKVAREIVFRSLQKLKIGTLTIIESFDCGQNSCSERFGKSRSEELIGIIEVKHPDLYHRILKGGSIAVGEAYMDGWWESADLTALISLMAINLNVVDGMESRRSWLNNIVQRLRHWSRRNTLNNSRENIHAHYDLGNDLYETFLDTNMLYSSGIFSHSSDSLEQAQIQKMERLCQQLQLTADDHVMEIGTGWASMAIYMAQKYGCQVTTTTISEQQYSYAQKQIGALGLENKITLLKKDYRLLDGKFDKLVSIEMIEAVGRQFLSSYIKKCQSLLKPGGLMAIQAITIADQRYEYYSNNVDFIQAYIFPGGFLPSVTSLVTATTEKTDLVLRDLFDIGLDYAKTLHEWHSRFNLAEEQVKKLGYDERFIRMWRYYLSYCEGGFKARSISAIQVTFQRPLVSV